MSVVAMALVIPAVAVGAHKRDETDHWLDGRLAGVEDSRIVARRDDRNVERPAGRQDDHRVRAGAVPARHQTGRTPVVFVHGLWLLPNSWDRWAELFEDNGDVALTPGWPDDPETVQEAAEHPEVFAGKSIGQIADHFETIIRGLDRKPAIIGHSTGGLLTQILAGRGLAAVSVAIDPAPFRGVLPLPISTLKSSSPVLRGPANHNRAVPLTYDQFRYGFADAVSEGRPSSCTRTSRCRPPARRCSRPPWPT